MIKRIVFALLLGTGASFYLLQDDAHVKQMMQKYLVSFLESTFDCSVTCTLKKITFIRPSIELENIVMHPTQQSENWCIKSNTIQVGCSWLSLLCYATLDLNVYAKKLRVISNFIDGSPSIFNFLQETMSSSSLPFPVYLRSCIIHDGNITVTPNDTSAACISWDSVLRRRSGVLYSDLRTHSGSIIINGKTHVEKATCTIKNKMLNQELDISLAGRCELTQLSGQEKLCEYSAKWSGTKGTFLLKNAGETVIISPASLNLVNNKYIAACTISMPLLHCMHLCGISKNEIQPIDGTCCLKVLIDFSNICHGINGALTIKDIKYKNNPLTSHARISFVSVGKQWRGSHYIKTNSSYGILGGTWELNWTKKYITYNCKNKSIIEWPHSSNWVSWPGDCSFSFLYNLDGTAQGNYACTMSNKKTDEATAINGNLYLKDGTIESNGKIGNFSYIVDGSLLEGPYLRSIACFDKEQNEVITFDQSNNLQWNAKCTVSFARAIAKQLTSHDIQGEGTILLSGTKNWNQPSIQLALEKGTIRLPGTYNFINELQAQINIDTEKKQLAIEDLFCGLHCGKIVSSQAIVTYNEQWKPCYMHCPLTIQSCLFTFNKDCFLTASGGMLLEGNTDDTLQLTTNLIMDRAQIGENNPFFSQQLQTSDALPFSDSVLNKINCNITITNKHPIAITTENFKAQAQVHMNILGTVNDPQVAGDVTLASGEIGFPYRPLYITKCNIHFIPGQLSDPIIELIAKNRVKQHNITMRVIGSAQQHDISFDSSPPLTSQQIISLLLAGSSDESMNVIMPALVMQNMKSIMFKSDTFKKSMWRLFRPFRYITLVPSFSDQTGRGGLRGSLEINIDDRWQALIQKNFSLSEDTLFELEYHISDDIAVRVYRDERRDVGGEVEVRWRW